MKSTFILSLILLVICSCSERKDAQIFTTPEEPILSLMKAANAQDSVAIINTLTSTTKESVVSKLRETGGFKALFDSTKGLHQEVKILKIETDKEFPNSAKVFVNETFVRDTLRRTMDSVYFYAFKEENGWKLSSLSPRYDRRRP